LPQSKKLKVVELLFLYSTIIIEFLARIICALCFRWSCFRQLKWQACLNCKRHLSKRLRSSFHSFVRLIAQHQKLQTVLSWKRLKVLPAEDKTSPIYLREITYFEIVFLRQVQCSCKNCKLHSISKIDELLLKKVLRNQV